MSNMFTLSGSTHTDARRGKLDVVTAAMLNGGASSGWLMGQALRPCASRDRADGGADAAPTWQQGCPTGLNLRIA